jgi:hypothetical protein
VNFKEKKIIYVDTVEILKKKLKKKKKLNMNDLGKIYLGSNYKEKHSSNNDTLDLLKILKKVFKDENFFLFLKNFIFNSETGVYFNDCINLKNK